MNDYHEDQITVILSVWKRNNLQKQLNYILNQSVKPHQIWIYQNESHLDINIPDMVKEKYNISIIQSQDINFKFHARFALPLLVNTEYTAIFDDDTMPGTNWLRSCLETSKKHNCIVGANGRILKPEFKELEARTTFGYGDGFSVEEELEVDFVGHCWFFKTEWCKNIWKDRPLSWDNGEDIHFAASCQIYQGISCYVPKMPSDNKSIWGDLESHLGRDEHASWKRNDHEKLRSDIIRYWCKKGWSPLTLRNKK
jgi:hypothetical protein